MNYTEVNPNYMLEMESLSLLDYAKVTLGARERPRASTFYHTGYNFKYLMPAETDDCLSVPLSDCDATPGCSTHYDIPYSTQCVASSRIHDIKNNGEVWKRIPGNSKVLKSSFYVVGTGSIDSEDLNLRYSHANGPSNMFLYYKLFLSKRTNTLYCIFSSAIVFDDTNLITLLTPVIYKLIESFALIFKQTPVEHICVSGHSMGAIQTVILAYVWETLDLHMDIYSKTTFIAFGPYKVLPTEWYSPRLRVYFTMTGAIDPFAYKGNPSKIQYMKCFGIDGSGIKMIENRYADSDYKMFNGNDPLHAGSTQLHDLSLYIELGKKEFRKVQGGKRTRKYKSSS